MLTLVTGATGLVGNNVVRLLLERGLPVRALVRTSSDGRPLSGLDLEIVRGDLRDPAAVAQAVRGVHSVIHAAAEVRIGWTGLESARSINVGGTTLVAAAARTAGAKMVHVSSVDALGLRPFPHAADEDTSPDQGVHCPYVVTKREAEQAVLREAALGLDVSIINPAFMLGPWDWKPSSGRMLLAIAKGQGLLAPLGRNTYCDVRDVAAAALTAAERGTPGRRYILGGECLTYFQAWKIFAEITGGRAPILPLGPLVSRLGGWCGDLKTRFSGREGDINSAATAIARQHRVYSSARAEAELDYRSRDTRASAQAAWNWFQQFGYA